MYYCKVLLLAVKVCCDVLLCVTNFAVKACCETVWCNRSFKVSVGTKVSCRDLALKQGINRHNSMLIVSFCLSCLVRATVVQWSACLDSMREDPGSMPPGNFSFYLTPRVQDLPSNVPSEFRGLSEGYPRGKPLFYDPTLQGVWGECGKRKRLDG